MSGSALPARELTESSKCLINDVFTGDEPRDGEFDLPIASAMRNLSELCLKGDNSSPLRCDILCSFYMFNFVSPPKTISSNLSFRILNSFVGTGRKRSGFFFSGSVAGRRA